MEVKNLIIWAKLYYQPDLLTNPKKISQSQNIISKFSFCTANYSKIIFPLLYYCQVDFYLHGVLLWVYYPPPDHISLPPLYSNPNQNSDLYSRLSLLKNSSSMLLSNTKYFLLQFVKKLLQSPSPSPSSSSSSSPDHSVRFL